MIISRALRYGYIAPVLLSAIPGFGVAQRIFNVNRFNLWGPGKLYISLVTATVPSMITMIWQTTIEKDLLLQLTPCPVCLETRAVAMQMLTGVVIPSTMGLLAANHQLIGQAWKPEWMRGICLVKRDLIKCQNIVIGSAILQAVVVSMLMYQQRKEWWHVRDELQKRKAHDENRSWSSCNIITRIEGNQLS